VRESLLRVRLSIARHSRGASERASRSQS
jgi:hypothetical protein